MLSFFLPVASLLLSTNPQNTLKIIYLTFKTAMG